MKLSHFAQGRDNNFNLIRAIAALAVLITHCFALVTGDGNNEPLRQNLGVTLGSIAVDVFFITSGFLVTASLISRQNVIEFIFARLLRIFPALFVMLILTVFVLGPVFTTWPLHQYLSSPEIFRYFARCMTLIFGVAYELPGVFEKNAYPNAVNGSLWSMTYEVLMYAILAVAWLLLLAVPKLRLTALKWLIVASTLVAGLYIVLEHFYLGSENHFGRLYFLFFVGATFYILRSYVALSHIFFAMLVVSVAISTVNKAAFFIIYTFSIPYILFYLSYVPSGWIRNYNRLGDYSYGMYIYAFPVQQSIAAIYPDVSVLQMAIGATIVTAILAVLSWHLVERRALSLKGRGVDLITRLGFSYSSLNNPVK